jgi:hypothetical protein
MAHWKETLAGVPTKLEVTDEQSGLVGPIIKEVEPPRRADGKGRPGRDAREVLNDIMWILRTGA